MHCPFPMNCFQYFSSRVPLSSSVCWITQFYFPFLFHNRTHCLCVSHFHQKVVKSWFITFSSSVQDNRKYRNVQITFGHKIFGQKLVCVIIYHNLSPPTLFSVGGLVLKGVVSLKGVVKKCLEATRQNQLPRMSSNCSSSRMFWIPALWRRHDWHRKARQKLSRPCRFTFDCQSFGEISDVCQVRHATFSQIENLLWDSDFCSASNSGFEGCCQVREFYHLQYT